MKPFTVVRSGQFVISRNPNSSGSNDKQCGVRGQMSLSYRVVAQSHELDVNGFVVDHALIDEYFQSRWINYEHGSLPSCEQISKMAVYDLWRLYRVESHVRIWSNPVSSVSYASDGFVPGIE
jgi:hypothetical protein